MRTRIERDNLWALQHNPTPIISDLWNIVVSYYAEDPLMIEMLDLGIEFCLSDGFQFYLPPAIDDNGFATENWYKLDLYHILLILPILFEDGSEAEYDDSDYETFVICSPDDSPCSNISRHMSQIRHELYTRLHAYVLRSPHLNHQQHL